MDDNCRNCGNWNYLHTSKNTKEGACRAHKIMTTEEGWCKTHTEYTEDKD